MAFLSHIRRRKRQNIVKGYDNLPSDIDDVIIISEWLLNDEKTGPIPSALMSLTMIQNNQKAGIILFQTMLTGVGFTNIEKRPLAGPVEIVIGYKK